MTSNFDFVGTAMPSVHADCVKAESYLANDPRSACFYARRAVEGGTWSVEVSLSQTAMWYLRMGDDNDAAAAPESIDVSPFLFAIESDDFGPLHALAPALSMSETPPRWDRGPSRIGAHEPVWLPR